MNDERASTGGDGATTDGPPSASRDRATPRTDLDTLFGILADRQRRRILAFLDGIDADVTTISDLVDNVADAAGGSHDRERVAVTIHHNHLPKLSDAGLVEYDDGSRTVRYDGSQAISEWVELVRTYEPDLPTPN